MQVASVSKVPPSPNNTPKTAPTQAPQPPSPPAPKPPSPQPPQPPHPPRTPIPKPPTPQPPSPPHLGHERAPRRQELGGQPQGLQHQHRLGVCLAGPRATHLWGLVWSFGEGGSGHVRGRELGAPSAPARRSGVQDGGRRPLPTPAPQCRGRGGQSPARPAAFPRNAQPPTPTRAQANMRNTRKRTAQPQKQPNNKAPPQSSQPPTDQTNKSPPPAHVWRAVVEYHVEERPPRLALYRGARGRRGDVADDGPAPPDRLYGREVDAQDEGGEGHGLGRDLHPPAGRGAEVEHGARAGQEVVLAVELDKLERGAGAEAAGRGRRREGRGRLAAAGCACLRGRCFEGRRAGATAARARVCGGSTRRRAVSAAGASSGRWGAAIKAASAAGARGQTWERGGTPGARRAPCSPLLLCQMVVLIQPPLPLLGLLSHGCCWRVRLPGGLLAAGWAACPAARTR